MAAIAGLVAAGVGAIAAPAGPPTKLSRGMYFRTLGASATLPRSDRLCASLVTRRKWEPRPENALVNHTVPDGSLSWPATPDQLYWKRWIAKRRHVTGRFTGTTDEIIRWAGCKWGVDENVLRAVAVQESYWRQATVGDGGGSFGLMQVKDHYSDGTLDLGGYPWTQRATGLNVDLYAAWIRACLAGDFYDGGTWLYGGKRVQGDLWGCVGAWYSGDWYSSGAIDYVTQVRRYLATRAWRHLGP
jgi:hypothetical protein